MTGASAHSDSPLGMALGLMWDAIQNRSGMVETPLGKHGIDYHEADSDSYATVGFILPEPSLWPVYAEIEDGTYGELQGLRFYTNDDDQAECCLKDLLMSAMTQGFIHAWQRIHTTGSNGEYITWEITRPNYNLGSGYETHRFSTVRAWEFLHKIGVR